MKTWMLLLLSGLLAMLIMGEVYADYPVEAVWFSTDELLGPDEALERLVEEGTGKPVGDGAFGFSTELFWVLVEVCGADEGPIVLDIRNPHIDRLDAWLVTSDGSGLQQVASTGDALGPLERSTPNRRPVVHLSAAAKCHLVLLRVDKRMASVSIPLAAMSVREFEVFELRADAIHGGIFAVFLLVIALGIVGFVQFREPRFASYSVFATMRSLYMFLASGYANMTLLAAYPDWTNPLRVAAVLPPLLALLWFTGDFFELGKWNSRLHRQNRTMMLVLGLSFVVVVVGRALGAMTVPFVLKGMYLMYGISLLHFAGVVRTMWRKASRATGYFVAAFGGSMGVVGYVLLEELGVVPVVGFAVPLMLWAALVEVVVLLIGAVQLVIQRLTERQALLLRLEQVESEKMLAFVEGLEEERLRVARELHDGVGAELALISHQIQQPPPLVTALQKVIRSVRRLSSELNPTGIHRLPLDASLRQLAESYAVVPVQLHLMLDPWPSDVPGRIEFECYRIAQEALQNAVKHAGASQIFISLHHDADARTFSLTIEDDGVGFDPSDENTGQGLRNMQFRANSIGAGCSVDSAQGKGTFVEVVGLLKIV